MRYHHSLNYFQELKVLMVKFFAGRSFCDIHFCKRGLKKSNFAKFNFLNHIDLLYVFFKNRKVLCSNYRAANNCSISWTQVWHFWGKIARANCTKISHAKNPFCQNFLPSGIQYHNKVLEDTTPLQEIFLEERKRRKLGGRSEMKDAPTHGKEQPATVL